MNVVRSGLALLCGFLVSPVLADNQVPMEEIVVIGTRTETLLRENPYAVSTIAEEELRFAVDDQLGDVLRRVPGVLVTDAGQAGQKRIRIRGEESRRVALLIDGQEFIDHREVGVPLLADINRVQRIEVVRGPASVLYGPKAMGGVVNIITRAELAEETRYWLTGAYNSATSGSTYYGRVLGSLGEVQLDLSGSVNRQDDRDTPVGEMENTTYDSSAVNAAVTWQNENHEYHLAWEQFKSDSEVYVEDHIRFTPPFLDFSIDAPRRDREKIRFDYLYSANGDLLSTIRADIYHQISDREFNTFPLMSLGPGLELATSIYSDSQLISDGVNVQVDLLPGDRTSLIGGVQWVRDDVEQDRIRTTALNGVETSNTLQVDEAEIETLGAYIQGEYQFTDALTLYAGLRAYDVDGELGKSTRTADRADFDDKHTVGSLAMVYSRDAHVIRLNYSEGYIYPSMFNLVIGAFAGSSFVVPDPGLVPETSETMELGYRFAGEQFSLDATVFHTQAEDYIDHVPCRDTDPCTGRRDRIYRNIGEADSHGLELAVSYDANPFLLRGGLTWLKRHKEYEGVDTWKSGVPELSGYLALEHSGSLRGRPLFSRLVSRFESDSEELNATRRGFTTEHNAGYGVVDLEFFLEARAGIQLGLIAGNLGDKKYHSATENLWAAGRHVRFKFTLVN